MKGSFLYRLQLPDQSSHSFLLGTMHVKDERAFSMFPQIEQYIDQCEAFAAETNLGNVGELSSDNQMRMLPDNQTLDQFLPDKKYDKLQMIIKKAFNVDIKYMRGYQPIFITSAIDQSILGQEYPLSMDHQLWKYAEEKGKKLAGVETIKEQQKILESIPLKIQIDNLVDIGANVSKYRKRIDHLANLYTDGNIAMLYRISKKGLGKLRKLLLYDRNTLMAERIYQMIQEQPTFCAVGAGHLWGQKGVLRKLKNMGISYKPMPWNNTNP